MDTFESLNDSVWERKYHGGVHSEVSAEDAVRDLRRYLEEVFRTLMQQASDRGRAPRVFDRFVATTWGPARLR